MSRHLLWNCPNMDVTVLHWWSVNIGSGNGLVPLGNKPLPESMLTQISGGTRPQCQTVPDRRLSASRWCHRNTHWRIIRVYSYFTYSARTLQKTDFADEKSVPYCNQNFNWHYQIGENFSRIKRKQVLWMLLKFTTSSPWHKLVDAEWCMNSCL